MIKIRIANGVTITTESNNKTVLNGTKLELEWTINVSPGDTFVSTIVYLLPDFSKPLTLGQNVENKGKELYGENRLFVAYENSKYTMTLKDVKYNESGTFRLYIPSQNNGANDTQSDIHVIVTGRANLCNHKFGFHYTASESEIFSLFPNVCGYPIPDGKWKVGEDTFSTLSAPSVINKATRRYKYSFNTRPISRKDCGKNFTFITSNTIGSMDWNVILDVKFLPSLVSNVLFYRHNASCVRVTWNAEDTGKCNISYHLQFAGTQAVYNISSTDFTLCNSSDVDVVFLWASYKENIGGKLASRISATTSSPDTNLTNNAGENIQATCNHQYTSNIVTGIVTLAVTLIINTIIFVIFKHKGFIILSMSQTRPPQSNKNQRTNDYEATGATICHYADINSKAVKEGIYEDLTTTADHSKQYYEIELNTMQGNIYANTTT
ncbi:uncharacterized protein LOC130635937 isoform X2 [Hydractinia symbiolongicarpus]|uniref:uncharacterized protein LOC130635937 isoform X2 n=1 Tax=Hydractinia symbiolongicarpus TaxID=13093 RepID=UPI00254DEC08|nr:uncharacterized protein LOC130635937 isoform X2 [Hydractinia symbiolongicarpus]